MIVSRFIHCSRRALSLLLVSACAITAAHAQTPSPSTLNSQPSTPLPATNRQPPTANELRGMWVICDSLESPASIHQVIVTAKKYGLNALFVQVRSRGDAWYNSPYEPRAEGLSHQPREFDPLTQMVAEGHKEGLEIHAWLNTFITWSKSKRPRSSQHVWNAHPDWFSHDWHGSLSTANTQDCEGVFMQPSNPQVQQHLFNVFTDVASRYDVDGIHFDYVRYPNSTYDFSPVTVARFNAYMQPQLDAPLTQKLDARLKHDPKAYVHAFGKEWETWRRAQVTGLVTRISQAVKANKPWMQVSAAVFPDGKDASEDRGQDWMHWLRDGVLDSVSLMAYNTSTARIVEQTKRAVAIAGDRKVYTGIGAWRLSAHNVAAKIARVRQAGASGVNLFSYDEVHNRREYLSTLSRGVFASRSAPPRMGWLPSRSGSVNREGANPEQPKTDAAQPDVKR